MEPHEPTNTPAARTMPAARSVEQIQAQGRLVFAANEIPAKSTVARNAALRRLAKTGAIQRLTPRSSTFVIIPPESRSMGCPPIADWLDDAMRTTGHSYYLGLLSAAEIHGSSHFGIMETQVVTQDWIRPIRLGRTKLRFFQKPGLETTPVKRYEGRWGGLTFSSPEATCLDILRFRACGTARAVIVIRDLAPQFKMRTFKASLEAADDTPSAQRMGFILDLIGATKAAAVIANWLAKRHIQPIDLSPGAGEPISFNNKWMIKININLAAEA